MCEAIESPPGEDSDGAGNMLKPFPEMLTFELALRSCCARRGAATNTPMRARTSTSEEQFTRVFDYSFLDC